MWVKCKCTDFLAAVWCTGKWLRLYQTIRNLTSSEILWCGNIVCGDSTCSNWIEKYQARVPPRPVLGKRGDGECDLSCVEHFWMIGLMVVMLMFYLRVVSVFLVFSGVGVKTLNFQHSSLSVIQQEIFKKIVLMVHTWDEWNLYLHVQTTKT